MAVSGDTGLTEVENEMQHVSVAGPITCLSKWKPCTSEMFVGKLHEYHTMCCDEHGNDGLMVKSFKLDNRIDTVTIYYARIKSHAIGTPVLLTLNTNNKVVCFETTEKLPEQASHRERKTVKLAEGCCSAISPCSHQQLSPDTLCETCSNVTSKSVKVEVEGGITPKQLDHLICRFLQWKLPPDFAPDGGITYERKSVQPIGTNLFTYGQAKMMVRFMVEGMPKS